MVLSADNMKPLNLLMCDTNRDEPEEKKRAGYAKWLGADSGWRAWKHPNCTLSPIREVQPFALCIFL